MALSMIVEMTSLTPRVDLRSTPAMPAHATPTSIATRRMTARCRTRRERERPRRRRRRSSAASRYWPSTPMLNRFILKPIGDGDGRRGRRRAAVEDRGDAADARRSPRRVTTPEHVAAGWRPPATIAARTTTSSAPRWRRTGAAGSTRYDAPAGITAPCPAAVAPVMWRPSSSGVDSRRVEPGDDAAAVHDEERVGQADQLLEVGRDRAARPARRPAPPAAGPRWPPARRRRRRWVGWAATSELGVAAHLPADDAASAGCRPTGPARARRCPACARRTRSTMRSVSLARAPRGRSRAPGARPLGLVAEHPVLPERRLEQQPLAVAVLGDVADAPPRAGAGSATR